MPNASDLTVKKYDNATDVIYVAKAGASGDSSPAIYRLDAFAAAQAFRPELKVWSRASADRLSRIVEIAYFYPQLFTESTTGLSKVANRARFQGKWTCPMDMPTADLNEFAAQAANLFDHIQMVDTVRTGYAFT